MAGQAKKQSKYFRIATEGATTDGRTIERAWIEQMAKNYNPQTYGARVNLEHIKGVMPLPGSPFGAYGDVLALSTEEADGKLRLLAQISPTDDLVTLNKARQKVYTSCEINTNFAETGEAYLVGLAVTDNPASLGTEMLQFSAQATVNPLAVRKTHPHNLFSSAAETVMEFEDVTTIPGLVERIKTMFARREQGDDARFADVHGAVETIATQVVEVETRLSQCGAGVAKVEVLAAAHEKLAQEFAALKVQLSGQQGSPERPHATGGTGAIQTDC
ncbi:GPO family capsid scaffolding protein [Uliginosibacterium gangwonense]|uniref:GPO family capsid scaffolding protein n=1 Tax=Uliginosibacterium gangwonense TaxID=392736 RepID=UPI0003784393|nr:GPO family capsid scaffolding protein [Uliginosibacterium gangwonense]